MAIPMEGKYSKSELLELKNKMNAKALAKRRSKTALRLAANIIFAILVLLPLLYAVSIAPYSVPLTRFRWRSHQARQP